MLLASTKRSVTASAVFLLLLAGRVAGKTDLDGCVSSATVAYGGASLIWYVPDTGEICQFLDCGGGRAPPKTTVPGCDQYSGTATYSPSFLPDFGASPTTTSSSSLPQVTQSAASDTANVTTPPSITSAASSSDSSRGSSASPGAAESTSSVPTAAAPASTAGLRGIVGAVVGVIAGVAVL